MPYAYRCQLYITELGSVTAVILYDLSLWSGIE